MKTVFKTALKAVFIPLLLLLMLCLAVLFTPYKEWAAERAVLFFAQRGIVISSMKVQQLLPSGIEIADVTMTSPPMTLELLRMNVLNRTLEVQGLVLPQGMQNKPVTLNTTLHMSFKAGQLVLTGELTGQPGTIFSRYSLFATPGKPENTRVHIDLASMRWMEGTVSTRGVDFLVTGSGPVPVELQVDSMPLEAILQQLVHPQARATGNVGGTVNMQYRLGNWSLLSLNVNALQPGTLRIPPGVIPAGSEEMLLVAETLSNFHYSVLNMATTAAPPKAPLRLHVEGSNPVYNGGQQVKLNVNLNGDVLDVINRSLAISNNPGEAIRDATASP